MNEADKIIERIKKDSNATIKEIIENAKTEAESIRKSHEKETKKTIESIRQNYEKEASVIRNMLISGARIEAKRQKLNMREEIINECLNRGKKRLSETKGKQYEEFLKSRVTEGIKNIGKDIVVDYPEKDKKIVEKIVSELRADLGHSIDTIGGVVVKSKNGKIRVDNTFEGIIKRNERQIRKGVSEILFGEKNVE